VLIAESMVPESSPSSTDRAAAAADHSRQNELARLAARLERLMVESENLTARLNCLQEQSDREALEREQRKKKTTQQLFASDPGHGTSP
jgi:hypothetical protein